MLVVLLEILHAESALFSRYVEYLAVVETAFETLGKQLGDYTSSTAYLSSYVDDYLTVVVHLLSFLYVVY